MRALSLLLLAACASCSAAHTSDLDAAGGDTGCASCVGAALGWGMDGGFACTRDSSALSGCRTYTHRRVAEGCDPIDRMCSDEIPACDPDAVDAGDLAVLLADADVLAAIAAAPVLYGHDSRPVDGQVFRVTIDGAVIEVGSCADATCSEIPIGVRALEAALTSLDEQVLARGTCAAVFGAP